MTPAARRDAPGLSDQAGWVSTTRLLDDGRPQKHKDDGHGRARKNISPHDKHMTVGK
jgi:hypothetical protein